MPKSNLSRIKTGLRFGIAFGLMYMAGMQEVVVASSPFETYGWGFVAYQFFMGLGDAIPVIILCLLVTCIDKNNPPGEMLKVKHNTKANIVIVSIIAIAFVVERIIGYLVGYVDSDIDKFPVPVVVWTVVFGVVLGGMYLIIRPIYNNKNNTKRTMQIMVVSIGINWIWFNCFIGLIFEGVFVKMLIRSVIDVVVVSAACLLANFITKKGDLYE